MADLPGINTDDSLVLNFGKEVEYPGGHFNFIRTGVCDHKIGKLTHPQTKAGPSINKNRPILRLFTIEID